jgi:hypothetical protein
LQNKVNYINSMETNSNDHIPQTSACHMWNSKVHYRVRRIPLLNSILSQINLCISYAFNALKHEVRLYSIYKFISDLTANKLSLHHTDKSVMLSVKSSKHINKLRGDDDDNVLSVKAIGTHSDQ